jgi:hypothetical protein
MQSYLSSGTAREPIDPLTAGRPAPPIAAGRRRDWRDGLLVGTAGLVLLLIADAFVRDTGAPQGDDLIYELMAEQPFETHTFPFAYRVLVPTLVHLSPFGNTISFSVLAWLSSAACGTVAYVLMRRFGTRRWLAAALALCLALSPHLLVVSIRQGRNVDPETVLLMLAGGLAVADRRPLALGLIVAIGATVRESALFLVPFAYAYWAERPLDRRAAVQAVAAGLPGFAIYVALRAALPTVGLGYGGPIDLIEYGFDGPLRTLRRIFIAFGPLWLVAPFALRDLRYAQRGLVLVACCLIAFLFAGDWGRIVLLAAPVIYVAAAHVLNRRRTLALAVVGAFVTLNLTYAVYMQVHGVEANILDQPPPPYEVR